ncbi:MAG: slipin family protein [Defluviitaleaceae bacterium]|nr:slipin family protein [Defluviitaleaceae bacterium]
MKKQIINENQRGFLFKNGIFEKYLKAGKYRFLGKNNDIIVLNMESNFYIPGYPLEIFLKNKEVYEELDVINIKEEHIGIHYIDNKYNGYLVSGKYAFWNVHQKNTFKIINTSNIEVDDDIPKSLFLKIPIKLYTKIEVQSYQKGILSINGKITELLEPGIYYFWKNETKLDVRFVDTRALITEVHGQEILTTDKVQLRVNFVFTYKITDYVEIMQIDDFDKQLYLLAQFALREYIAKYTLDEILKNKHEIGAKVLENLKQKEKNYFVTFLDSGIKDIILPGDIKEILNQVLIAEKKAQANVILRREEVASTRSLLNTAKLLDENKTLYKLKELEYLEKIVDKVGNINLNSNTDLITQLTQILKS